MGIELEYEEGQTPLSDEEMDGLKIKTITTHGELDEFEQLNIEQAIEWIIRTNFNEDTILSEKFVKNLHKRYLDISVPKIIPMARLLLSTGADPDIQDNKGLTVSDYLEDTIYDDSELSEMIARNDVLENRFDLRSE